MAFSWYQQACAVQALKHDHSLGCSRTRRVTLRNIAHAFPQEDGGVLLAFSPDSLCLRN